MIYQNKNSPKEIAYFMYVNIWKKKQKYLKQFADDIGVSFWKKKIYLI